MWPSCLPGLANLVPPDGGSLPAAPAASLGLVKPSDGRLRATRAVPPGLASGDPGRRATYGAALQQFDDLMSAAGTVGPVTRPLPLYYAVLQAGKAITAAWAGEDWRAAGHGLTQDRRQQNGWQNDVLRFRVKPVRGNPGVFGTVAALLGAGGLAGSVELGALWAALPGASPPAGGGPWPLALPVYPRTFDDANSLAWVSVVLRGASPHDADAVNSLLAAYPGAIGATATTYQGSLQFSPTPWGPGAGVMWPPPAAPGRPGESRPGLYPGIRLPGDREGDERWLVPPVGEGAGLMPPVLLWWVLLFGLSLLARYEPAAWQAALDLDISPAADPLTQLLDDALTAVPALLFDAATCGPGT